MNVNILIIILIGIGSFFFDQPILSFITSLRHPYLDTFFLFITKTEVSIGALILVSLFLYRTKKGKKTIIPLIPLWGACGASTLLVHILKAVIMRPRPTLMPLIATTSHSFPSGHAGLVFAVLPFLSSRYWLIFALLVAISRLYLGVHYLSDIIFGGIIGYGIGILFREGWKKWFHY